MATTECGESVKLLIIASLPQSLLNFRGDLIIDSIAHGTRVCVAAPGFSQETAVETALMEMGATVREVSMARAGMNPIADLRTLFSLARIIRDFQPDCVLAYTIKPVIYGVFVAWLMRVPRRIALITGLGFAFVGARGFFSKVMQWFYGFSVSRATGVIFQNPDDELLFRAKGLLSSRVPSVVVNGSGVCLTRFCFSPVPRHAEFLLIARFLVAKGVREYAMAARELRIIFPEVKFHLVGWIDDNPDSICEAELGEWVERGDVIHWGRLEDVRPVILKASVLVLPSEREGTPRAVLEAMAMGRAIITTDAPGCRETVVDGENGFLVPVKSTSALVNAMRHFIDDPELSKRMGIRSRQIAEEKYDVRKVNEVMLRELGLT